MKHYVISLDAGSCFFDYKCSRISDAYNAVLDASAVFDINVDLDAVMDALVHMEKGAVLSHKQGKIMITRREGEV